MGAYSISVFDAEEKGASRLFGNQVVEEGGPETTEMHGSCGAGCKPGSERESSNRGDATFEGAHIGLEQGRPNEVGCPSFRVNCTRLTSNSATSVIGGG